MKNIEDIKIDRIEKPTIYDIFQCITSGVGLDIAKNHTGVFIWHEGAIETYGFTLSEYDKTDYFAEYRMRMDLRSSLQAILGGRDFEYMVVEDVYGGENFDTLRKLISLNTVPDELIFGGVCSAQNFIRWSEAEWVSAAKLIYKQRGKLKPKIEIQELLQYLEFDFACNNKDLSDADKKNIYYEDICDACGMLLGAVMKKIMRLDTSKKVKLKISDIKMVYVENYVDFASVRDKVISCNSNKEVVLNLRCLEKSILTNVERNPDMVLFAKVPVASLGSFGIKHRFKFFESGTGYLFFYKKSK